MWQRLLSYIAVALYAILVHLSFLLLLFYPVCVTGLLHATPQLTEVWSVAMSLTPVGGGVGADVQGNYF